MKKKRAIVTGAAGYIGSHLVLELAKQGWNVRALDRFRNKTPKNLFGANERTIDVVQVDIARDFDTLFPIFRNVDVVFHLAGINNTPEAQQNPYLFHESNVNATICVLEAARKAHVAKLVYAASASCYGRPMEFPTPETARIELHTPYALTKYLGETYLLHWAQVYKLRVVSLRLFSIYGPGMRRGKGSGLFLSTFLDAIREHKTITITGDGTQSRDMVYISDVVSAFLNAAERKSKDEIFNVGSGKSISMNEVIRLLGWKKVRYVGHPQRNPDKTQADISRIRKVLDWNPRVDIQEGIQKIFAYEM